MRKWVVISVVGALLLGGLAFLGYRIYLNEVDDRAVELVPPDAVAYANIYLNPSTRQKQALRDLLRRFPSAGTADEARTRVEGLLDDALAGLGLEFADDVEPWLGRQIGLYVRAGGPGGDPAIGVLIATEDADATERAVAAASREMNDDLTTHSYKGVSYDVAESGKALGIVGDFLVIASGPEEIEASVDAMEGRSLADTERFSETTRGLPSDRIALFYLNLESAIAQLRQETGVPIVSNADAAAALGSPGAAVAYLRPDGIVLEASLPGTGGSPGEILAALPAEAWGALGIDDLGGYAKSQLDLFGPLGSAGAEVALKNATGLDLQDDLLGWMDDFALYLAGSPARPDVTIEIGSRDRAASDAAVDKIQMALIRGGVRIRPLRVGELDGFTIELREEGGAPPFSVLAGERVIVSSSRQAATDAAREGPTLQGNPVYEAATRAIGARYGPALFIEVGTVLDGISRALEESSPELSSQYETEIKPDVEPFSFIIYGTRREGDRTNARLVIGVE